jgi:hypothetical protein
VASSASVARSRCAKRGVLAVAAMRFSQRVGTEVGRVQASTNGRAGLGVTSVLPMRAPPAKYVPVIVRVCDDSRRAHLTTAHPVPGMELAEGTSIRRGVRGADSKDCVLAQNNLDDAMV